MKRLAFPAAAAATIATLAVGCGGSPGATLDAAANSDVAMAADLGGEGPAADVAGDGAAPASARCASYCDDIARTCAGSAQYDSRDTCLAYCSFMPAGSASTPNTLACRAEALARFEPARPTTSCLAAGPGGDLGHTHACGSPCAAFCGMAAAICPSVFADAAACMNACARFPPLPPYGSPNVDRDTYGCRLHYLTQAAVRPDINCPNITATSPTCR